MDGYMTMARKPCGACFLFFAQYKDNPTALFDLLLQRRPEFRASLHVLQHGFKIAQQQRRSMQERIAKRPPDHLLQTRMLDHARAIERNHSQSRLPAG